MNEDEKRLFIRGDIKQKNMLLAEAAHRAGIITSVEYATFQNAGYKGLSKLVQIFFGLLIKQKK